jgi:hypothetical protein
MISGSGQPFVCFLLLVGLVCSGSVQSFVCFMLLVGLVCCSFHAVSISC